MPVRYWTGSAWIDGTMGVAPGDTDPIVAGVVRAWPWTGGLDLLSEFTAPAFAGERFGYAEAADGTAYAAGLMFTSETLGSVQARLAGHCDLRVLSTGELVVSNAATVSGTAVSSTSAATWDTRTVASPLGGAAQPAAFWDHASYPSKSVAHLWASSRVLMPEAQTAAAATALLSWITTNDAQNAVIPVSTTYSEVTTFAASSGVHAMYRITSGYPGDGTHPSFATMAAADVYAVLIPAGTITSALVAAGQAAGLKVWTGTLNTADAGRAAIAQGVDGIMTAAPTVVASAPITPPPTSAGICHGYTWASGSSGQYGIDYMMNTVGLRRPGVVRAYNAGKLGSNISGSIFDRGIPVSLSMKPPKADGLSSPSGAWRTYTESWLRANVPKSVKVYLTSYHEPEGDGADGSAWQATWIAHQSAVTEMCVELRADGWQIYGMPILCSWLDYWNDGHSFARWAPTDGSLDVDVMGWDDYPMGNTASGTARIGRLKMTADNVRAPYAYSYDPVTYKGSGGRNDIYATTRKIADHAQRLGVALGRTVPWANLEVGLIRGDQSTSDTQYSYTLEQRAQWFRDYGNDLYNLPALGLPMPLFITWYFHGGCFVGADHGSAPAAVNSILDLSVPL